MSDKTKTVHVNEVILRSYPKVIFFYPLLLVTLILWIIQIAVGDGSAAASTLGAIWFIVFFANMFVIAFDFSSTKFFILILAIVVVGLLVVFIALPGMGTPDPNAPPGVSFDMSLSANFYLVMTLILAFMLGFVILGVHFSYYKIERNEIYYKKGMAGSAERFPVKSLRMIKEIPDIFEYLALRAGSITLIPSKDKVIILGTVLNINKKAAQIDDLLSRIRVEVDDHV